MKNIYLFIILTLIACGKQDQEKCYECKLDRERYSDVGCMTKSEWESVKFTDPSGNGELDKRKYCRKK